MVSLTPDATAWRTCVPAVGPSVQVVDAVPSVPVVPVAGLADPPPIAEVNVTALPATPLPRRSCSLTRTSAVSAVPTVPLCASPEFLLGAWGTCATVTTTLALALPELTEITAVPFDTAVTTTLAPPETEATAGADDDTDGVAVVIVAPFWSRTTTVNCCVARIASSVMLETEAAMLVATSGGVESLPQLAPSAAAAATRITRRAAPRGKGMATGGRSVATATLSGPPRAAASPP